MTGGGRKFVLGALIALVAGLCLGIPGAGAEAFGQLEVWGAKGTGKGQFNDPAPCAVFGVDPVDGSVYAGDSAPGLPGFCRIQKFSASGSFKGSTTIQYASGGTTTHFLVGIAVDHSRERFYLIEDNGSFVGTDVLRFSTAPDGSQELVSAGSALPLPGSAEALKHPEGIAVDPADGDIVVMGLNATEEHVVILRLSNAGAQEDRFDETGNPLHKSGRVARSVAIGKEGRVYTVTGRSDEEGKLFTRAWELPADLSELKEVPGFAAAAQSEAWPRGVLSKSYSSIGAGTQLAISPDGDTLYFKENGGSISTPTEPGEVVVRGYSLSEEKTKVIYGGGEYDEGKGACAIATSGAPIGTFGSELLVFDHANEPDEAEETYGPPRVVTFGPGGSGCVPAAHFKVSPAGGTTKGEKVGFDAEESDLAGNSLESYEWDFGDGTTVTVEGEGGEPAGPTTSHRFLAPGEYMVKLKLNLANAAADPPAAEQKVVVAASSPVPFFEVFPGLDPAPGATVEFDAGLSRDPAGGSCSQLTGCDPSFQMQSYEWDFGDGTKAGPNPSPTVTHAFANPGTAPLQRTVTLTVETKDGVKGTTAEVITVQGTPDQGGGGEVPVTEPPVTTPPVTTPTPTPPVTKKTPTDAEKRAQARKKCKKLKGKAKSKCMKRANAIGKKKSRSSG
jgi:PKD repeat protein